jgi:hypothetical protein
MFRGLGSKVKGAVARSYLNNDQVNKFFVCVITVFDLKSGSLAFDLLRVCFERCWFLDLFSYLRMWCPPQSMCDIEYCISERGILKPWTKSSNEMLFKVQSRYVGGQETSAKNRNRVWSATNTCTSSRKRLQDSVTMIVLWPVSC